MRKTTYLLGMVLAVGVVSALASSGAVYAADVTEVTDTLELTVAESCTVKVSGLSHQAVAQPGQFNLIGEDTQFTLKCNYDGDYQVIAVGDTNNEEGNTNLVGTAGTIATGLGQSGASNWSMKVNPLSEAPGMMLGAGFDNFAMIPSEKTPIVTREKGANGGKTVEDKFSVSYGAYISGTQTPGTYAGKVKYTFTSTGPIDVEVVDLTGTMQEFKCSSLGAGQLQELKDARDGNTYTVSKLRDGRCWMVENLRLASAEEDVTLDSTLSDVSGTWDLPQSSTAAFNNGQENTAGVVIMPSGQVYYSWKAATAGTGTTEVTNADAPDSICPRGWRLPTGGPESEIVAMAEQYTLEELLGEWPNPHFDLPGYFTVGSLNVVGQRGYFWSSTAAGASSAYLLAFLSPTNVTPVRAELHHFGFSVRCIAEN